MSVAALPVTGGYLVNTAQNHSELHGPFADWRRRLNAAVAREGRPLDPAAAARFGLDPGVHDDRLIARHGVAYHQRPITAPHVMPLLTGASR